jgi:hypothetical protein
LPRLSTSYFGELLDELLGEVSKEGVSERKTSILATSASGATAQVIRSQWACSRTEGAGVGAAKCRARSKRSVLWGGKIGRTKNTKTSWQGRAKPLNKREWRAGRRVSARFSRAFFSKIGAQELFLVRNPVGSIWKGKVSELQFCCDESGAAIRAVPGGVLSKTAGVRPLPTFPRKRGRVGRGSRA